MKVNYLDIEVEEGKGAIEVPFYWGTHATARFMDVSGRSLEHVLSDSLNLSDVLIILEIGIEEGQVMRPSETPVVMDGRRAGRMVDTHKYLASKVLKIVVESQKVVSDMLDIDPDLIDDGSGKAKKKKKSPKS